MIKKDEIEFFDKLISVIDNHSLRNKIISEYKNIHPKRIAYILEKWEDKGIWESGISVTTGWFNEECINIMNKNRKETDNYE